jgi:hypothetical protein
MQDLRATIIQTGLFGKDIKNQCYVLGVNRVDID